MFNPLPYTDCYQKVTILLEVEYFEFFGVDVIMQDRVEYFECFGMDVITQDWVEYFECCGVDVITQDRVEYFECCGVDVITQDSVGNHRLQGNVWNGVQLLRILSFHYL